MSREPSKQVTSTPLTYTTHRSKGSRDNPPCGLNFVSRDTGRGRPQGYGPSVRLTNTYSGQSDETGSLSTGRSFDRKRGVWCGGRWCLSPYWFYVLRSLFPSAFWGILPGDLRVTHRKDLGGWALPVQGLNPRLSEAGPEGSPRRSGR